MVNKDFGHLKSKKTTKPSVMTDAVVSILSRNLAKGYSVEHACALSGVSRTAFYDYCTKYPDRAELFQLMRMLPTEQAMNNIVGAINRGDLKTSKWYIDRVYSQLNSRKANED